MALILTFLGKGGTGRTTIAIAAAKRFAAEGKRVLLAGQDTSPALSLLLGTTLTCDPQPIAPNLKAVQFESTTLLQRSWEQLKKLEAEYIRTPFFKEVYGEELGILPGMDSALALNAIREYDAANEYDVIVYDGKSDKETLRMLGMPEMLSWYIRRFRGVLAESELGKALSPFVQPVTSAVLNVGWSMENIGGKPADEANQLLDRGKQAVSDPNRVVAYLVTSGDRLAVASSLYLWGSAQQVGLTVGGVICNLSPVTEQVAEQFSPLPVSWVPHREGDDWQPLLDALPDFSKASGAPRPIEVDVATSQVRLFLPGFDKKQVKLTQYGPEVTIEAGDQRRNIFLPAQLRGKPVKGAKFQQQSLIISF
ncbi:Get3/ArsA fold putative tail anchor-mediating ATPase NosAFP [Phormidium sp. CCY1219]|uniref:Get3/ArsA fold putative tail anchor-mediating ATPase NosAFP n=1 Tax=Phormidium sp. CCY1219 TaxID=2886104 RepID=UPI002D1F2F2B|nr:ArsA family ATPase [Phormidium sp. CCY1219]MEB3826132.1 ArsA family ATPase [Phormidium sp. CCY1219]